MIIVIDIIIIVAVVLILLNLERFTNGIRPAKRYLSGIRDRLNKITAGSKTSEVRDE